MRKYGNSADPEQNLKEAEIAKRLCLKLI